MPIIRGASACHVQTLDDVVLMLDEVVLTLEGVVLNLDNVPLKIVGVSLKVDDVFAKLEDAECVLGLGRLFRLVGRRYGDILKPLDGRLPLSHRKSGNDVHGLDFHTCPSLGRLPATTLAVVAGESHRPRVG